MGADEGESEDEDVMPPPPPEDDLATRMRRAAVAAAAAAETAAHDPAMSSYERAAFASRAAVADRMAAFYDPDDIDM